MNYLPAKHPYTRGELFILQGRINQIRFGVFRGEGVVLTMRGKILGPGKNPVSGFFVLSHIRMMGYFRLG